MNLEWITYENVNASSQIILAVVAILALIYAVLQYRAFKKEQDEKSRPFVFLELEKFSSGLYNIILRNTGSAPAVNIAVKFSPNIQYSDKKKINELQAMKNLNFLGPGKNLKFFLGSVMGGHTEITKEFTISGSYQDLVTKKTYQIDQKLDPTDEKDLHFIVEKSIHDIAKSADAIKKSLEKISGIQAKTQETLRRGIIVRNLADTNMDLKELLTLLSSYPELKDKQNMDMWLNPYIYDTNQVLKQARTKLLALPKRTNQEKKLLNMVDDLFKIEVRLGSPGFEEKLITLKPVIEKYLHVKTK